MEEKILASVLVCFFSPYLPLSEVTYTYEEPVYSPEDSIQFFGIVVDNVEETCVYPRDDDLIHTQ